jgi:hypothetical protein
MRITTTIDRMNYEDRAQAYAYLTQRLRCLIKGSPEPLRTKEVMKKLVRTERICWGDARYVMTYARANKRVQVDSHTLIVTLP